MKVHIVHSSEPVVFDRRLKAVCEAEISDPQMAFLWDELVMGDRIKSALIPAKMCRVCWKKIVAGVELGRYVYGAVSKCDVGLSVTEEDAQI